MTKLFHKLFLSDEKQALLKKTPPTKSQEHVLGPHESVRVWDVKMPPIKAEMISGKLVPTFGRVLGPQFRHKTSRIALEIHYEGDDDKKATTEVEGILRGKSMKHSENETLRDDEFVVLRIFRPVKQAAAGGLFGKREKGDDDKNEEELDDECSASSFSLSGVDQEFADGKWIEAYLYNLEDIEVLNHHHHTVELKLGRGSDTKVRDIIFANDDEAMTFCDILQSLGKLQAGQAQRRLEDYLSKGKDLGSKVQLLVEVVSAVRLPVADIASTDAYVTVHLGKNQVHKTDFRPNTLNPIWTVDTGSLFMLDMSSEQFFGSGDGLMFSVYDYDALGQDDLLGKVFVSQEDLLEGSGKREEFSLILEKEYKKAKGCKLVLRFRPATPADIVFMKALAAHKKEKVVGAFAGEAFVPIRQHQPANVLEAAGGLLPGNLLKRETRKTKAGSREFRVKPEPDPERPEETKWMTEEQINDEALKPSTSWIRAESGLTPIGRLHFELIGCDGLPNKDSSIVGAATGGVLAGKTDAYACIIYEDSIVNTDVIFDSLHPRWMPWTQRAFVFDIMHPTSQLMLAVLDYDSLNPFDGDDPIGRVTIDPSNLRPMTDYTMQFDLFTSSLVANRKLNGTVTVRVRIEWENGNERKALIKALNPPPEIYVNVAQHRDFLASHYAIVGGVDTKVFSMDTLTSYVDELQGYQALVPVMKSALFTVLLWRGHFPITLHVPTLSPRPVNLEQPSRSLLRRLFKPVTLKLPLHSIVAFLLGILLVEDYNLFPSFLLFGIAWVLLGTMEYQNSHPSPWRKKRTYLEHLQVLVFNRQFTDTIDSYENNDEIEKYKEEEARRKLTHEEEAAKEAMKAQRDAKEQKAEEKVAIVSEKQRFGISLNIMQPILSPVQQNLGRVIVYLRIAKSFVTWEQSRASFWLVNACVLAGILLVGIPWDFLIHWAFRIAVWIFLGPWMKLVDILFVKGRTREELREAEKERLRMRYQRLVEARRLRQIKREDALKLRSMKRYMFGSWVVGVPRFNENRYYDVPLYPSHASPHVDSSNPKISASFKGQHLELNMIPEREQMTVDENSSMANSATKDYGSTK